MEFRKYVKEENEKTYPANTKEHAEAIKRKFPVEFKDWKINSDNYLSLVVDGITIYVISDSVGLTYNLIVPEGKFTRAISFDYNGTEKDVKSIIEYAKKVKTIIASFESELKKLDAK